MACGLWCATFPWSKLLEYGINHLSHSTGLGLCVYVARHPKLGLLNPKDVLTQWLQRLLTLEIPHASYLSPCGLLNGTLRLRPLSGLRRLFCPRPSCANSLTTVGLPFIFQGSLCWHVHGEIAKPLRINRLGLPLSFRTLYHNFPSSAPWKRHTTRRSRNRHS